MLCVFVFFLSLLPLLFGVLLRPGRCHEHNEGTQRKSALEMTFVMFTIICIHFVFDMKIRLFGFCVHWNRDTLAPTSTYITEDLVTHSSVCKWIENWLLLLLNGIYETFWLAHTHGWRRVGSEVSTCWRISFPKRTISHSIHTLTFSKAQRWHQNELNLFNKWLLVFANNNEHQQRRHHL